MKKFGILILFIISFACKETHSSKKENGQDLGKAMAIENATGFSITKFNSYSVITVNSPWANTKKKFIYVLAEKEANIPENLDYDQEITIPVKKVVATSTTHIPAIEALDEIESLKGFPDLDFISSEKTRTLIKADKIKDVGNNENLNTELLIDIQPDVVIGFSINATNKSLQKIQKAGIPVIYNGEWTEATALGKAEWIKFFGALYNKNEEAKTIFDSIKTNYINAKKLAKTAKTKPTVFSGSMYKDQWYVPFGNSWQANIFNDAHATYVWSETEGQGSLKLSFEKVLNDAKNADFWVSTGQFTSYNQLFNQSSHLNEFKAVKNRKVYSVSMSKGATGGILFYELGPSRPDLILKDLIKIFHPKLLPDYTSTFIKELDN
ncbi:ABC transporter substrate-binding protein [Zunongwangia sp.]|uniref:ABC transporter substrate-binding protein n=1 Tax=Zunongwangia sp. TaxID=1965325 RepID=UPI003AA7F87D